MTGTRPPITQRTEGPPGSRVLVQRSAHRTARLLVSSWSCFEMLITGVGCNNADKVSVHHLVDSS